MKTPRQSLGAWGERQAARYLSHCGYAILARNVRTQYGEIDLVARHETQMSSMLVFVEVKTRSSTAYGMPEDAITLRKQAHMLASAQAYLQEHPELDGDWRVDVIAIQRSRSGDKPQIVHFENVIS